MPIPIRAGHEIALMRTAGAALAGCLSAALTEARPGVTTAALSDLVSREMASRGAEPVMPAVRSAGGRPFPSCASVCLNEEVVHGIPGPRIIRPGDLVTIDVALRFQGWCVDAAASLVVPGGGRRGVLVREAAARCLEAGLGTMGPGVPWSRVSDEVRSAAAAAGVELAAPYAGHGIGRALHEPPEAGFATGPGTATGQDFTLRPGMVLTLEPIVMEGRRPHAGTGGADLIVLDDGWTVVAPDRRWACHEERTVAITRRGPVVLTEW